MNIKAISLLIICSLLWSDLALAQRNKVVTKGPDNGTLLIIGGRASNSFYEKFGDLIGGYDQPIVVIPTATTSQDLSDEYLINYKKGFEDKGFKDVTVLHTRDPMESNTETFIAPIHKAKGVWFSGGRQWRHADSYLNTKAHDAFHQLLDRGGVIAGSSAGATIQGSYLARGDTKTNTIMMGDHEEGLSFLTNVAIDQHLFARNRQFDLFEILDHKPELLGIGLDEDTGIIVQNDRFSVYGSSYVAIYDGTHWSAERNLIRKLDEGSREFYMLRQGDEYDLVKRKVIEFKDREFIQLPTDQLKKYEGLYESDDEGVLRQIRVSAVDGTLINEHLWNGDKRELLIESSKQMITKNSNFILQFNEIDGQIKSFFIPIINVTYNRIEG